MSDLKPGDTFTIKGVKRRKDGTWTKRRKPGNETVWVVVEPPKRKGRPRKLRCPLEGK